MVCVQSDSDVGESEGAVSATMIVVLVALLLVVLLVVLWLRDRSGAGSARPPSGASTTSTPAPTPASYPVQAHQPRSPVGLTTSDIAWAVCGGIWLFVVTSALVGLGVAAIVIVVLRTRG